MRKASSAARVGTAGVINERKEDEEFTIFAGYPQTVKMLLGELCLKVANPEPVKVDRVPPPAPTTDIDVDDNTRGIVKKRFVDFAKPIVPTRTKGVCLPAGLSPRKQAISVLVQEEIVQGAFPTVTALPAVNESPKRAPDMTILSPLLAVNGVIERIEGVVELEYK